MKTSLLSLCCFLISCFSLAQNKVSSEEALLLADSAAMLIPSGIYPTKALDLLDQSLAKDSTRAETYFMKALVLCDLDQAENALKMYDDLERRNMFPKNISILSMHGSLLYRNKNIDKAKEKWQEALDLLLAQFEDSPTPGYFFPLAIHYRLVNGKEKAFVFVDSIFDKVRFEDETERVRSRERITSLLQLEDKHLIY